MIFQNRDEAASKIADDLKDLQGQNPLVLAIPRGAVPMARIIAERLEGDLDIVLVHKFSFSLFPEYAIGSVTEEGDVLLGIGAERLGLDEKDVEASALSEIRKLQTKRQLFTPDRTPVDPRGRVVIVVDDGIATGATMMAAVHSLQNKGASRIIVATPVASPEAVRRLESAGATVRSLSVPEYFNAVSEFYEEFAQVSDDEAIEALRSYRRAEAPTSPSSRP